MMDWMRSRPLLAALAGLALLLGVVVVLEGVFGTRASDVGAASTRPAPSPDAKMLPPLIAQAPDQAFPEMTARPLFTPTRRPAPADPTTGRASLVRGQFVLQGVIVVGDQRTALLKEKATGKVHRVDRGNDVNGITVEHIDATEVTLGAGGEHEKVALVVQRADGKAPPTPVAADSAGPFGPPPAAAAPPAAPVATATAPAPGQPSPTGPGATPPSQLGRPLPPAQPPGTAPASQPNAQPMSPEELLARRRARRNQPTQ
jgi:hypothetical protein